MLDFSEALHLNATIFSSSGFFFEKTEPGSVMGAGARYKVSRGSGSLGTVEVQSDGSLATDFELSVELQALWDAVAAGFAQAWQAQNGS